MKRSSRGMIALVLIAALGAAGGARWLAWRQRGAIGGQASVAATEGRSSLSGMNSFALTLMLGGLRGPLVMILWPHAENQKNARNLEGIDTQIEWIRLLQSEFDSVHLFQIWNKAYNISVQMASLSNKYAVILDALDYAQNVNREKPNNINIVGAIGQIYLDKLGNSYEKSYYIRRVREETLAQSQPAASPARGKRQELRRMRMDPLLDAQGNLLGRYLAAETASGIWSSGDSLSYLKRFQPFSYGVSPVALAYNYFKQAQLLQRVGNQRHIQIHPAILDSRAALCLKIWCEEERGRGYAAQARAMGMTLDQQADPILMTAGQGVGQRIVHADALSEAIFSFSRAAKLSEAALEEYEQHIKLYQFNFDLYQSHMDEVRATERLMMAERDFLAGGNARGEERNALMESAKKNYSETIRLYQTIVLKYYVDEPLFSQLVPSGCTKTNLTDLPQEQLSAIMVKLSANEAKCPPGMFPHGDELQEFGRFISRSSRQLLTLNLRQMSMKSR